MTRLQSELQRLYLLPDAGLPDPAGGLQDPRLISAAGEVRALVMALARPADWDTLGPVWRGVQQDLQLPAPAIAVSGSDALQLWFSLQQPVSTARAAAFLAQLQARYLPGVAPARVQLLPSADAPARHAALVPAAQPGTENWSAFIAPDLAPVFADTPWLDIPPGVEGQADLLARLESIKPAAFDALVPPSAASVAAPRATPASYAADVDPRRFLQQVLNDEAAPLALRVEAAATLLRARAG